MKNKQIEKISIENKFYELLPGETFDGKMIKIKEELETKKTLGCIISFIYSKNSEDLYISIQIKNKIKIFLGFEIKFDDIYEKISEFKNQLRDLLEHVYFSSIIDEDQLSGLNNVDGLLVKSGKEIYLLFESEGKIIKQTFNFSLYIKVLLSNIFDSVSDGVEKILLGKPRNFISEFIMDNKML